jgi:prefoldin subunit 5
VFNKNAPDTEELKKLNEEIKELNDNLEALSMFDNPNDLPKDSPLSTINKDEIQKNINTLTNKRNNIEEELQELLRK